MQFTYICFYCGHQDRFAASWQKPSRCPICNDKRLNIKKIDSTDVFGYDVKEEEDEVTSYSYD